MSVVEMGNRKVHCRQVVIITTKNSKEEIQLLGNSPLPIVNLEAEATAKLSDKEPADDAPDYRLDPLL